MLSECNLVDYQRIAWSIHMWTLANEDIPQSEQIMVMITSRNKNKVRSTIDGLVLFFFYQPYRLHPG